MHAIRIYQTGGPEVLQLEEVELPPPGKGEARVRLHASGVNYIDIYHRIGQYALPLPLIPGGEGAGEIVAVGEDVKGFKRGDRVAFVTTLGCYAEERNVNVNLLVKLPRAISYETAAAMMLKGLTAQYLLRQTYRVHEGDNILVHAAAGGVGQILCQWGKALGANVIATVGSDEKAKIASACRGQARHQLQHREFCRARRRNHQGRQMRGGLRRRRQGDVPRFARLSEAVRHVRQLRLGFGPDRSVQHRPSRNKRLAVCDASDAVHLHRRPRRGSRRWRDELFEVVGEGKVKISVSEKAPLAEAARIHAALEARKTTGSVVLIP